MFRRLQLNFMILNWSAGASREVSDGCGEEFVDDREGDCAVVVSDL